MGVIRPGTLRVPLLSKGRPETRRHVPIAAFCGPNGSGKTACAISGALGHMADGRHVLSTVPLLDPATGDAHPLYIPLTDWRQFLDARSCHILLDEVTGVADAREFASMPVQLRNLLVQLRKRDVTVAWTSPAWQFADVTLRRVTQTVTVCRGFAAVERPGSMWRDRRLFSWRTYDAADLDEFTEGKRSDLKPLVREFFWGPGSEVFRAYDTLAQVHTLGHISQSGQCLDCGGRRTAPKCSCSSGVAPTLLEIVRETDEATPGDGVASHHLAIAAPDESNTA